VGEYRRLPLQGVVGEFAPYTVQAKLHCSVDSGRLVSSDRVDGLPEHHRDRMYAVAPYLPRV
jgi:hypothetical protein